MRLQAVIRMYGGGEGSGCQGPNCGRPKSGSPDSDKWMRLELKQPKGFPLMIQNDAYLVWHETPDKKHLIIEVENADGETSALGMGMKTVYSIKKDNIAYWGHDIKDKKEAALSKAGSYIMDMDNR